MKFIKQKYLTIIFSIAGGIILGLALTFAFNSNAIGAVSKLSGELVVRNMELYLIENSTTDKQIIITNTGDVGIGTTAPDAEIVGCWSNRINYWRF